MASATVAPGATTVGELGSYLRPYERSLRAANCADSTVYKYLLAQQLIDFYGGSCSHRGRRPRDRQPPGEARRAERSSGSMPDDLNQSTDTAGFWRAGGPREHRAGRWRRDAGRGRSSCT
jgi:hypothetical protein